MAGTGNPNVVVRFDHTPESRFYMCRSCRNHLFSLQNQSERTPDVIICQNAVNVETANVESVQILHTLTKVDAICKDCNTQVGWKNSAVRVGRGASPDVEGKKWFHLVLNKMLLWNGNKVVYADSEQPVEVVRFDQTPESRFYMCRSCKTGIFSLDDEFKVQGNTIIFCQNAVNVWTEGVKFAQYNFSLKVVNASCKRCNSKLGQQILSVSAPLSPSTLIKAGNFMLEQDKMLLWDGNQVVYADTLQAAGDN